VPGTGGTSSSGPSGRRCAARVEGGRGRMASLCAARPALVRRRRAALALRDPGPCRGRSLPSSVRPGSAVLRGAVTSKVGGAPRRSLVPCIGWVGCLGREGHPLPGPRGGGVRRGWREDAAAWRRYARRGRRSCVDGVRRLPFGIPGPAEDAPSRPRCLEAARHARCGPRRERAAGRRRSLVRCFSFLLILDRGGG
jgi:hypothetical protein